MQPKIAGPWQFFIAPCIVALLLFASVPALQTVSAAAAAAGWIADPTATPEPQPAVSAPMGGEGLQGQVVITGTTGVPGFRSMELSFSYQADSSGTWFLLQHSTTPVTEGILASWDTTTITDGVYQLRLLVFLQDGQVLERRVTGLRVRNYTTIETSTPEVRPPGQPTITATSTPRADYQPSPLAATPLPTNPAQITGWRLGASMLQGVLVVFGAGVLGVLYVGLRAVLRR